MFEHFGFMDALSAIKKYIVIIIAATLVFGCVGVGLATVKNNNISEDNATSDTQTDIIVSELYLVSGKIKENITDKNQVQYNRDIALMISSMLNADHIRQSVFETIFSEFEADDVLTAKDSLKEKYQDKIIKNEVIGEFVNVAVLGDSSVLRIQVVTENEQLSDRLLALYREKFLQTLEQINNSGIESTYSMISDSKHGVENEIAPVSVGVSMKKYLVLFAAMGAALSVCAVLAWALFFPVINRRCDIEGYKTALVSDKKESVDFLLHGIERKLGDDKSATVAVVVCKGAADKKKGEALYRKLVDKSKENNKNIEFVLCYDPASNFGEFEKIQKCDCAIILACYSQTKHTEYQKNIARLNTEAITVLGAVAM